MRGEQARNQAPPEGAGGQQLHLYRWQQLMFQKVLSTSTLNADVALKASFTSLWSCASGWSDTSGGGGEATDVLAQTSGHRPSCSGLSTASFDTIYKKGKRFMEISIAFLIRLSWPGRKLERGIQC